eukprot:TRINITY_DN2932_c0_g1_i1.p1 TRINITY_DN2932_c0_g1~~TRINITY_DN2932_c0_g1_i1.p1  ORF type:complete len:218 (+),score=41.77 TRINITY_DN2932_c0_g1_i1:56-655(+)
MPKPHRETARRLMADRSKELMWYSINNARLEGGKVHEQWGQYIPHFAAFNIIGDLTEWGDMDHDLDWYKSDAFDKRGLVPGYMYESLGNHDIWNNNKNAMKAIGEEWTGMNGGDGRAWRRHTRGMFRYMRDRLKDALDLQQIVEWDHHSLAYWYRKGDIAFINLQMHPAFKSIKPFGQTRKKKYRLRGRSSETAKAHRG